MLRFHNTLTRQIEEFHPFSDDKVTLYTCGPTVYDYLHVGNWMGYVQWDVLVRVLTASGYHVERVMNITDVGHLVSDADEGEDKLEKGARREGKTAWEVAEFYAEDFIAGMEKLGLLPPEHLVRATDFIPQQLDLVRVLKEEGYTYQTTDGIYFDTSQFTRYADFAHLDLDAQKAGARVEANDQKRQPWDFALWKFTEPGVTRDMEWATPEDLLELPASRNEEWRMMNDESDALAVSQSTVKPNKNSSQVDSKLEDTTQTNVKSNPSIHHSSFVIHPEPLTDSAVDAMQGKSEHRTEPYLQYGEGEAEDLTPQVAVEKAVMGFPGWHLECSAMAMSILGPSIDMHTGGIDHIPVHHTNEIAQSEAASGQSFANYWLHNNHLKIDGGKISKSLGNGHTLQNLAERGYRPSDLKLFILQSQYSNEGNFTFDNLTAAKNRLTNWINFAALRHQTHDRLRDDSEKKHGGNDTSLLAARGALLEALQNNLNTPEALRIIDETFDRIAKQPLDEIHQSGLTHFLESINELLGLDLLALSPDIDDTTKMLLLERARARERKDWPESDRLRDELLAQGIAVRDTNSETIWSYV